MAKKWDGDTSLGSPYFSLRQKGESHDDAVLQIEAKFYKHDLAQSRKESLERYQKANAQKDIPAAAESQILHLIQISEKGLPDCYTCFDDFLCDFWVDFSWIPKATVVEVEAVLADARFKKLVPILKETWGVDIELELRLGLVDEHIGE